MSEYLTMQDWWAQGVNAGTGVVAIEAAGEADDDAIVITGIYILGDGTLAGTLRFNNGTDQVTALTLSASMDLDLGGIKVFQRPHATNGAYSLEFNITGGNILRYLISGHHAR